MPIRRDHEFILGRDYQTAAEVAVYEGEHPQVEDNHLLGEFELQGLPAAKRGQVKIVVVFDVDADGIMNVSAREDTTGRSEEITVRCLNFLGPEELRRMQADAERMEAEATEQERRRRAEEDSYSGGEEEEGDDDGRRGRREEYVGLLGGSGEGERNRDRGREEEEQGKTPGDEQEGDKDEGLTDRETTPGGAAGEQESERDSGGQCEDPVKDNREERQGIPEKGGRGDADSQSSCPRDPPVTAQPKPDQPEKSQQDDKPDKAQDDKPDKPQQDAKPDKPQDAKPDKPDTSPWNHPR